MGAVQARLVFFAFAGLVIIISYNAIFLQKGRHPAPITVETTQSLPSKRPVRAVPGAERRSDHSQAPATEAATADMVKAIQRELTAKGYDPGAVDGVAGVLTRAAIMAYQHDQSLPVTGSVSTELLQHVVLGTSVGSAAASSDGTMPPDTVALIKAVQQILAELGYGPGPVDGVFGMGTQRAIEAFERERNMPVKGRISGKLIRELMRVTGAQIPVASSD